MWVSGERPCGAPVESPALCSHIEVNCCGVGIWADGARRQMDKRSLLLSLKEGIRGKFEISERNLEKIKETCVIMENKIGILMERMGKTEVALEELD
ncbi:hypothetical protein NDU88_003813 [Pleurodeles waltl]|uniref:Uncharacterized protein n=1 Tax=Pleurodeles waltl TaxID=8319 RepID=A0AAV7VIG7_PLEWA|nr:hypothetical protein NDU88_003813 [Pleurodeles waltl]